MGCFRPDRTIPSKGCAAMIVKKTALVTGGAGFVGSHLVDLLLKRGYHVRCFTRRDSDLQFVPKKKVEVVYGDVLEKASLERALKGVNYVFHLAAIQHKHATEEEFFLVNATGTQNLLEACCQCENSLAKVIHISSISAVGPRNSPERLTEESPCMPIDSYGMSKLEGEKIALAYTSKIPLTILRPPLVFGPRDRNPITVLPYMKMVNRGFYLTRRSGLRFQSIIYVNDLAAGLIKAAETNDTDGRIYMLCNEEPTTSDEICRLTAEALDKKVLRIAVPSILLKARNLFKESLRQKAKQCSTTGRSASIGEPLHWVCDSTKALQEFGFKPKYSLCEGVRETARWYVEYGWI